MGGSNSGRWGGKPTVEGCQSIVITVSQMLGQRDASNELEGWSGSLTRTHPYSGAVWLLKFRSVIHKGEQAGWVDVEHDPKRAGEPRQAYRIHLQGSPQPFGGLRWWFVCPMTAERVHKLYLPNGGVRLASREGYRLGYSSQRETPHDRAINRAWKARLALGGRSGVFLGTPLSKPKYRHWRTFDRDNAALKAKEDLTVRYGWLLIMKLEAQSERARQQLERTKRKAARRAVAAGLSR